MDQVLEVARRYPAHITQEFGERITNIVYMGMGEPLHNLENVLDSIDILTHPHGFNISHRKITVSTSGLVPQMLELGRRSKVNLAVSLNATTDEMRSEIMPVNKRYNLKALLDGCRAYELGPGRRITFEYVLLKGLNDTRQDAQRILALLKGIPSKVNLIPYNPHPASPFLRPRASGSDGLPEIPPRPRRDDHDPHLERPRYPRGLRAATLERGPEVKVRRAARAVVSGRAASGRARRSTRLSELFLRERASKPMVSRLTVHLSVNGLDRAGEPPMRS